jgi:hypothetical protein
VVPCWKKARSAVAAAVVVAVVGSDRLETAPREEKPHSRRTTAWRSSPK